MSAKQTLIAAAGNVAPAPPSGPEYVVAWAGFYIATYPYPLDSIAFNSSTGWGELQSTPPTNSPTTIQAIAKSHNDSRIWVTTGTSPFQYMYEWDWTNGFGARTSKPTSSGTARGIFVSSDGTYSISQTSTSPYIYGYEVSSNGWGTAWSAASATLSTQVLYVNEATQTLVAGSTTTPYFYSIKYNRTAKTFGAQNNFASVPPCFTGGQGSVHISPDGTMAAMSRNTSTTNATVLMGLNPSTGVPSGSQTIITYSSSRIGKVAKFITNNLIFTVTGSTSAPFAYYNVSNNGSPGYTITLGAAISQPTNSVMSLASQARLNPAGDIMFISDNSSAAQATGTGYEKLQAWTWTNANGLGTKYSAPSFTSRYGDPWSGYPATIADFVVMGPNPNL